MTRKQDGASHWGKWGADTGLRKGGKMSRVADDTQSQQTGIPKKNRLPVLSSPQNSTTCKAEPSASG